MIRRLLRTTTFRLALGYTALSVASAAVLLGFIYWATAGYMARQIDETIDSEIVGLAEQYRQRGVEGLATVIRERIARDPAGSEVYLLVDPLRRPIVGNLNRWPEATESAEGWIVFELQDRATPLGNTYLARTRHFALADGFHLLVGRDARAIAETQQLIFRSLVWGLVLTLALGLGGGLLMARGTLRRLEAINRTSREIIDGDLGRRVPVRGTGDDFDQLAKNLNAMLDRIEQLMQGIRHVSEGIAHDLRSPLTRLRHHLEAARLPSADPREQRRLIEESAAEADTLLATFGALLRIAEAESGQARANFTTVELAAVTWDAIELYEPVAQQKNQPLRAHVAEGPTILGDRHLLSQAIANLLDNAIKYTPDGGQIDVLLEDTAGGPVLSVADNGPGVPQEYRQKVIERFFRLDPSRTTPGNGLGLSLVAAVAQLHGAALTLEDNQPGLRATLAFPRTPAA